MSTKEKMISCKHCGAEIAANAPVCPHCGGKNKKPLYKRPWFLVLAVLVILGGLGAAGGQEKDTGTSQTVPGAAVQEEITYTAADVSQLMVTLNRTPWPQRRSTRASIWRSPAGWPSLTAAESISPCCRRMIALPLWGSSVTSKTRTRRMPS